jgi:hypothetical protein
MSFGDIIVFVTILFFWLKGIEYIFKASNGFSSGEIRFLQQLFAYHLCISLFFSYYVSKSGGDALPYWFISSRYSTNVPWLTYFKTGTSFILFINYPLVKFLNISFYFGGLLYSLFGYLSFVYLYAIVRKFIKKPLKVFALPIFPYILFIPNLHFWSSGIGKDSLSLFATMLFFYSLFDLRQKWFGLIFAIILTYYIRPHIALFLMLSAVGAIIIDGKMKIAYKVIIAIVMIVAVGVVLDKVLVFLKVDQLNSESITQLAEASSGKLSKDAGSSINTANASFPFKIFTFLFRPLFFDINGFMALIISFENLLMLSLTILMVRFRALKYFLKSPVTIKAMLIFFVICSVAFSMMLSNLGIMIREKIPVIFCLIVLILWYANSEQNMKRVKVYKP